MKVLSRWKERENNIEIAMTFYTAEGIIDKRQAEKLWNAISDKDREVNTTAILKQKLVLKRNVSAMLFIFPAELNIIS